MVRVKDLAELTVRELWKEVKDEKEWRGELKKETPGVVRRLLEGAMERELVDQLHAG